MSITLPLDEMSTIERIQTMEELWDALCHEKKEIKSPAWHEDILINRKEKIESGSAELLTIEDLKKQSIL
ncbi:MAG: addiction module protein [Candidatus Auribacterota bacterium]|nr:addiction module protein [Candidatus Auribacterota bacterium]